MMNPADVVIIIILVLGTLTGARLGFIVEVATLLGFFIAVAAAKAAYPAVRQVLDQFAARSAWVTTISYLLVFLIVWGAIGTLARIVRRFAHLFLLGWADRLGGAIVGFIEAAAAVELLLYFGKRVPNHDLHLQIAQSQLAPLFIEFVPYLHRLFPQMPVGH